MCVLQKASSISFPESPIQATQNMFNQYQSIFYECVFAVFLCINTSIFKTHHSTRLNMNTSMYLCSNNICTLMQLYVGPWLMIVCVAGKLITCKLNALSACNVLYCHNNSFHTCTYFCSDVNDQLYLCTPYLSSFSTVR